MVIMFRDRVVGVKLQMHIKSKSYAISFLIFLGAKQKRLHNKTVFYSFLFLFSLVAFITRRKKTIKKRRKQSKQKVVYKQISESPKPRSPQQ